MADTTQTLLAAIEAARTAGDTPALVTACRAYVRAAKAEGAAWTGAGKDRFDSLPFGMFNLGVLLLTERAKPTVTALWPRRLGSDLPIDEMGPRLFRDLLLVRIGSGNYAPLPPTPPAEDRFGRVYCEEAERLRAVIDAFAAKDPAALRTALGVLERNNGELLAAALRVVAARRKIVL